MHAARSHSPQRPHSARGWTAVELIVVVGILTVVVSLLLPVLSSFRTKALKSSCASNMRQLHQALMMYSNDNSARYELYPTYLGNLFTPTGQASTGTSQVTGVTDYVSDVRVYVCPADNTHATVNAYGVTSLKPIYTVTPAVPADNKSSWAERYSNGMGQVNCSYLYEFSGRPCTSYTVDPTNSNDGGTDNDPNSFVTTLLSEPNNPFNGPPNFVPTVQQDDNGNSYIEDGVDRNYNGSATVGTVTWQDAKFFQLQWGDQYRSGQYDAVTLNLPPPPGDFQDPIDYYASVGIDPAFDFDLICIPYPRSFMPILRCFWHQTPVHVDDEGYEEVQNITLDGNIYSSSPYWERTCYKYGNKTDGYIAGPPVITSAQTAAAQVNEAFTYQIVATNNPTSYSAAPLPPGLTFDSVGGLISGTPTTAGTYQITIDAVNSNGDNPVTLTLTVNP